MVSLTLCSPAKINLFLHIHAMRPDGYHELSTLMQALSLFDKVTLKESDFDTFTCSLPELQTAENLVIKARDLFRKKIGAAKPVALHLEKHIPVQGGLGGGSSNAATVLWGLNELHGSPLAMQDLLEIAQNLGSDVPFFLSCGTAYCRGRGESIENVAPLNLQSFDVFNPGISLSTPEVFQSFCHPKHSEKESDYLLELFIKGEGKYENDLEKGAFQLKPELAIFKERLSAVYSHASMSGSGSSFFCTGKQNGAGGIPCYTARPVNRSEGRWYECENV